MAVQRGVRTPWQLRPSGRKFIVDDGIDYPCYQDPFGSWWCGHEHYRDTPLEEMYEFTPGWTAQVQSPVDPEDPEPPLFEELVQGLEDPPMA